MPNPPKTFQRPLLTYGVILNTNKHMDKPDYTIASVEAKIKDVLDFDFQNPTPAVSDRCFSAIYRYSQNIILR